MSSILKEQPSDQLALPKFKATSTKSTWMIDQHTFHVIFGTLQLVQQMEKTARKLVDNKNQLRFNFRCRQNNVKPNILQMTRAMKRQIREQKDKEPEHLNKRIRLTHFTSTFKTFRTKTGIFGRILMDYVL